MGRDFATLYGPIFAISCLFFDTGCFCRASFSGIYTKFTIVIRLLHNV